MTSSSQRQNASLTLPPLRFVLPPVDHTVCLTFQRFVSAEILEFLRLAAFFHYSRFIYVVHGRLHSMSIICSENKMNSMSAGSGGGVAVPTLQAYSGCFSYPDCPGDHFAYLCAIEECTQREAFVIPPI